MEHRYQRDPYGASSKVEKPPRRAEVERPLAPPREPERKAASSHAPKAPMEEPEDDTLLRHDKKEFLVGQPVLANLFHYFMITLLGALAFSLGGGLLVLIMTKYSGRYIIYSGGRVFTDAVWIDFTLGGSATAIWLLVTYFRKIKPTVF
jgi:uncharacterized membrane-anchored protein